MQRGLAVERRHFFDCPALDAGALTASRAQQTSRVLARYWKGSAIKERELAPFSSVKNRLTLLWHTNKGDSESHEKESGG
jgi:hypothetical protein